MVSAKRLAEWEDDSDQASPAPSPSKRVRQSSTASVELDSEAKVDLVIRNKDGAILTIRADDYVPEEGLLLEDETESDEEAEEVSSETEDGTPEPRVTLPVRLLKDFIIFDYRMSQSRHPITSLTDLDDEAKQDSALYLLGATVAKQEEDDALLGADEDSDDDTFEGAFIFSSVIITYWLDADPTKPMLWLRTAYAWYICDTPHQFYRAQYLKFWEPLYIARLVLANRSPLFRDIYKLDQEDEDEDEDGEEVITQEEFGGAIGVKGKPFRQSRIDNATDRSRRFVSEILDDMEGHGEVPCEGIFDEIYGSGTPRRPRLRLQQRRLFASQRPPASKRRTGRRPKVFMTGVVKEIAEAVWLRNRKAAAPDTNGITCNPATVIQDALSFPFGESDGLRWDLDDCVEEEVDIVLQPGKTISVEPYLLASRSSPDMSLAANDFVVIRGERRKKNELWFGMIVYFFEATDKAGPDTWAHVRWLQHMHQSGLDAAAHPRELVLISKCDNIPLSSVAGKIKVKKLKPGETPPQYDADKKDCFFLRYHYDKSDGQTSFVHARKYEFDIPAQTGAADEPPLFLGCWNCQDKAARQLACTPLLSDAQDKLDLGGVRYHKLDFVFLPPAEGQQIWQVGQIERFTVKGDAVFVRVQYFDRCEDAEFKDHKLYSSSKREQVDSKCLRGLASVISKDTPGLDLAEWISRRHHFYVDSSSSVYHGCCNDEECLKVRDGNATEPNTPPPVVEQSVMDWFHGPGGLSLGLEQAGGFKVRWGVDCSASASKTFKANHPDAESICGDANDVLKKATKAHGTTTPETNYTLPNPGEVDVLVTGPPCQGFSLLNTHRSPDDIKNTLVANMLSAVEHFRPRLLAIENVPNIVSLLTKKFLNEAGTECRMDKAAVRKCIERCLMELGYQIRWMIIQASQYGVPQTRRRFILLAALGDSDLPEFPLPTHTSALNVNSKATNEALAAPFPFTTIWDAIGDLPYFHWLNPKEHYRMAPTVGGDSYDAVSTIKWRIGTTGPANANYACPPFTLYQANCRGGQTNLTQHVTRTFPSMVVERVCNVPLRPGAGHRDLPHVLSVPHMTLSYTHSHRFTGEGKGKYARLSKDEAAGTVVTSPHPESMQGRVLHPTQNRIYTVRENARLQGFPDSYELQAEKGKVMEIYRLIGNAVPVPLARALGMELRKCIKADRTV